MGQDDDDDDTFLVFLLFFNEKLNEKQRLSLLFCDEIITCYYCRYKTLPLS